MIVGHSGSNDTLLMHHLHLFSGSFSAIGFRCALWSDLLALLIINLPIQLLSWEIR